MGIAPSPGQDAAEWKTIAIAFEGLSAACVAREASPDRNSTIRPSNVKSRVLFRRVAEDASIVQRAPGRENTT
jgi:hypothetical protein